MAAWMPLSFVRIHLQECFAVDGLLGGGEDGIGIDAGFRQLARLEIGFGVLDGGFDHGLHLLVGEAVGRLHVDRLLFAGAGIARGDVQDAVGVDQEANFDAGEAGGHGVDVLQIEAGQAAAILGEFALALQHVDQHVASGRRRRW